MDITTKNTTGNLRHTGDADVNWVEIALDTVQCKDSANKAPKIRFVKTEFLDKLLKKHPVYICL
jgi:hypothetical protein